MIRVLVNGAKGKMGRETVLAIQKEKDLALVAETDHGDDLQVVITKTAPHVVVDFTLPETVRQNALIILESRCRPVIGTTGLSEADLKDIENLANERKLGAIVCPNFAIGAILMMRFAAEASKYMPDIEIVEYHHNKKVDAPSGTAIKTAKMIRDANPKIQTEIPIHSVRLPGYIAHQEVICGGLGQTLTIRHDTISRESFMPGVILAVRKAPQVNGLVYGLEKLL